MARTKKNLDGKKRPKLVQATFPVKKLLQVTCPECHFQYVSALKESQEQHRLFHEEKISGLKISKTAYNKLRSQGKRVEYGNGRNWKNERIECFVISCSDPQIVKIVMDTLKHVNEQWLNSTSSSDNWRKRPLDCKVVMLVSHYSSSKDDGYRIIGITTTDPPPPSSSYLRGYQMDSNTSAIDRGRPPVELKLGVSRIFVSQKYRRRHLATFMLDVLLEHAVYGTTLTPRQVGFSQPSNAGCQLLRNWSSFSSSPSANMVLVYDEET